MNDNHAITIYTDGACFPNPGVGGWAYVLIRGSKRTEASGRVAEATNNRMELRAAIEALAALKEPSEVHLTSDSKYLVLGITRWIHKWKRSGWEKDIKNRDYWEQLDALCRKHNVTWLWLKGHSGNPENERCDQLANREAGVPQGYDWSQPRWRTVGLAQEGAGTVRDGAAA